MQIIQQTPTTLALRQSNLFSGCFMGLFGTPFLVAGLVVMALLGKLTTLQCDRLEPTQVACQLTASGFLSKKTTPIPLGQLQQADVEVNEDSDGDTYRVVLITKTGQIPLTSVYSSGRRGKRRIANQINAFLSNPEQMTLKVRQDDRWLILFGGVFALVGGGMMIGGLRSTLQKTVYVFDKQTGRLMVRQSHGFKNETTDTRRLQDIDAAQVIEERDSDGDRTYQTQLKLRSGGVIFLQASSSSDDHQKLAQVINEFLGQ